MARFVGDVGYRSGCVSLSHRSEQPITFKIEVDLTGTGKWVEYAIGNVPAGRPVEYVFPDGYQAYWTRVTASAATTATAWFVYE
jgi:hypothetical protein